MSFVCHKCKKPVYFAERIFSVGKDWHRECLRCEACNKVLTKGQHAEHKGLPYCHVPCYNRLFGPTLMRQGAVSNVQRSNITGGSDEFIVRFKEYNEFYRESSASKVLNIFGEDGEYYIQGLLRVCWGVKKAIKLQQNDNVPVPQLSFRKSYIRAMENEIDPALASQTLSPVVESPARQESKRRNSLGESDKIKVDTSTVVLRRKNKFSTVGFKADRRIRKRYSINGHLYDSNTCVFTPAFGAVMSVTVTSLQSVLPVITIILEKFKIRNSPQEFSLFLVDEAGALTKMKDIDLPLIERVLLGPEEVCHRKLFLMEHDADRKTITDVPPEIADFVNLPNALLSAFLEKYVRDEEDAIEKIKSKYSAFRDALKKRMDEVQMRRTSTA